MLAFENNRLFWLDCELEVQLKKISREILLQWNKYN